MILNQLVLLFFVPVKNRSSLMENKCKALYTSPAADVLEMKVERSICDSDKFGIDSYRKDYGPATPQNGREQSWD